MFLEPARDVGPRPAQAQAETQRAFWNGRITNATSMSMDTHSWHSHSRPSGSSAPPPSQVPPAPGPGLWSLNQYSALITPHHHGLEPLIHHQRDPSNTGPSLESSRECCLHPDLAPIWEEAPTRPEEMGPNSILDPWALSCPAPHGPASPVDTRLAAGPQEI